MGEQLPNAEQQQPVPADVLFLARHMDQAIPDLDVGDAQGNMVTFAVRADVPDLTDQDLATLRPHLDALVTAGELSEHNRTYLRMWHDDIERDRQRKEAAQRDIAQVESAIANGDAAVEKAMKAFTKGRLRDLAKMAGQGPIADALRAEADLRDTLAREERRVQRQGVHEAYARLVRTPDEQVVAEAAAEANRTVVMQTPPPPEVPSEPPAPPASNTVPKKSLLDRLFRR